MDGIICYIGIGSNVGNSLKNCRDAIENISGITEVTLQKASSFYRTEPVGIETQSFYTNAVIEIKTVLSPQKLLQALQKIENIMGRKRYVKGGPRIIDLDLLFYGQNVVNKNNLTIPHPEIQRRRFVLEPLCEIASFFIHPSFGVSIKGLRERLSDNKLVEKIRE